MRRSSPGLRARLALALTLLAAPAAAMPGVLPGGVSQGGAPATAQARGGLAPADLDAVALAPAAGARAPLDLSFRDALAGEARSLRAATTGTATVLIPVDYACRTLCDPMLGVAAAALAATGLAPGRDYRLVLVGLGPADDAAARAFAGQAPEGLRPALVALTGGAAEVTALTDAVGYRFRRDPATGTIAHPAGAVVLALDGRVARALSVLGLDGPNLRLALVEAGEGRVGTIKDRIALLCYGFDAARGLYTPLALNLLSGAAGLTLVAMAGAGWLLARRGRPA